MCPQYFISYGKGGLHILNFTEDPKNAIIVCEK